MHQVWVRVWDPVGHKYLPYYWQEEKKQLWYVSPYHWWYVSPYHWLCVSPYHWWYVSPYHWRPDILYHPPPWAVNWHPHVGMTGWQPLVWKWPGVPCGPYVGPGCTKCGSVWGTRLAINTCHITGKRRRNNSGMFPHTTGGMFHPTTGGLIYCITRLHGLLIDIPMWGWPGDNLWCELTIKRNDSRPVIIQKMTWCTMRSVCGTQLAISTGCTIRPHAWFHAVPGAGLSR